MVIACAFAVGCAREQAETRPAGITVVGDAGDTVRLAAPAQRIASLMPTVTDLLIAMNVHDRLIARTDYDTDAKVAQLPSLGGGLTPSLNEIKSKTFVGLGKTLNDFAAANGLEGKITIRSDAEIIQVKRSRKGRLRS